VNGDQPVNVNFNPDPNHKRNKEITILIVAVIVIAAVILAAKFSSKAPSINPSQNISANREIRSFPVDIPIPNGTEITHPNLYEFLGSDNKPSEQQIAREFLVAETSEKIITDYSRIVGNSRWQEVSADPIPGKAVIAFSSGDGDSFTVVISPIAESNVRKVSIIFIGKAI
jgi:hypothetical protein